MTTPKVKKFVLLSIKNTWTHLTRRHIKDVLDVSHRHIKDVLNVTHLVPNANTFGVRCLRSAYDVFAVR